MSLAPTSRFQRITISCRCVWSPTTTASNVAGGIGDRLGVSIVNLSERLMVPRAPLTYQIGNDVVFQAPLRDPAAGVLLTDSEVGPTPLSCKVVEVIGTRSAIVSYRISFVVNTTYGTNNVVLTNRWTSTAEVSFNWLTTLTTSGRATLRADLLSQRRLVADQFRSAFLLPIPLGFQRERINVVQTPNGCELAWTTVDVQKQFCLPDGPAVRVEGASSIGADSPLKDIVGVGRAALAAIQNGAVRALVNIIPTTKGFANLQAYGPAQTGGSLRAGMAALLLNIAFDRFWIGGGRAPFTSLHLLASAHEQFVELRVEMFGGPKTLAAAVLDMSDFGRRMNLSDDFTTNGLNILGLGGQCPTPPNGNGSRGTWVGALLAQVLRQPGVLPSVPTAAQVNANVVDLPLG